MTFFTLLFTQKLSATDFTWTGGTSQLWTDSSNWSPSDSGYPKSAADSVTIKSGTTYTPIADEGVTIGNLTLDGAYIVSANNITITGNTTIISDSSITCSAQLTFSSGGGEITGKSHKLTITGGATIAGNITALADLELKGGSLTISGVFTTKDSNFTVDSNSTFYNNGTYNTDTGSLTVDGTFINTYRFNADSGTITINGTITNNNTFKAGSGTIQLNGNFPPDGTGTYEDGGSETVEFIGTGTSTIIGNNTIGSLVCKSPGKTIEITSGTSQTLSNLTIEGSADSNITLTSTDTSNWTITVPSAAASVKYAKIGYSESTNDLTGSLTDCSELVTGTTVNWFSPTVSIFTWKGTDSSEWSKASNWEGGISPSYTNTNVEIILDSAGGYQVQVPGNLNIKTITINQGSTLDLKDYSLTTSQDIINEGTVKLYGTSTITAGSGYSITNSDDSEVIYYTSTKDTPLTANNFFGTSYGKLTIEEGSTLQLGTTSITISNTFSNNGCLEVNNSGTYTFTASASMDSDSGLVKYSSENASDTKIPDYSFYDLEVSKGTWTNDGLSSLHDLTISGGSFTENAALTVNNDFTVSGTGTAFTSLSDLTVNGKISASGSPLIAFNDSATASSTSAASLTTSSMTGGSLSFGNQEDDSFTLTEELSISGSPDFTLGGTITAGQISLEKDFTQSSNLNFQSPLVLKADNTIANNSYSVNFNSLLDGNYKLSITGSGNVTFNSGVGSTTALQSLSVKGETFTSADIKTSGDQTYTGNFNLQKNCSLTSESKINFDSDVKGSGYKLTLLDGDVTFAASTTIEAEIENHTKIINNNGLVYKATYTSQSGSSFYGATSGNVTFNSDVDFTNTNFVHNNGTVILNPDNTNKSITLKGQADFYNLTATNSGLSSTATIIFEEGKTQTVQNSLNLTGEENYPLNVQSSSSGSQWNINCTAASSSLHSCSYINLQDSNNVSSAYRLSALDSSDLGNNTRWDFAGTEYTWTGLASTTNWYDSANWNPKSVPGIGSIAIIPDTSNMTYTPHLESDLTDDTSATLVSIGSSGSIKIEENGQIDFSSHNVTASSIINNGKVKLDGSQTFLVAAITNSSSSTVEYYGNVSALIPMKGTSLSSNYGNLEFSQGANLSTTENLLVEGTTKITAGNGNTVELKGANVFTGNVQLGDSSVTPKINGGSISLKSDSNITIEANAYADSIEIEAPATLLGNVTTLSGNQTYKKDITIKNSTTLDASQIHFYGDKIEGSAYSLKLNSPVYIYNDFTFNVSGVEFSSAIQQAKALTCNGILILNNDLDTTPSVTRLTVLKECLLNSNCSKIVTSGNQVYGGQISISNADFNFSTNNSSSIEIKGSILSQNNKVTMTAKEIITSPSSASNIKAESFYINANYINKNDFTFNAQTYISGNFTNENSASFTANEDLYLTGDFSDSGTYSNPTHKLILNGARNSQTFTAKSSTTYSNISINKTFGTTIFENDIKINTLTDSSSCGSITFKENTNIETDTVFQTTSTLTLGSKEESTSTIGATSSYQVLTHTAGSTKLYGKLFANQANFTELEIASNAEITSSEVNLSSNITSSTQDLYLKINGNLTDTASITCQPALLLDGSYTHSGTDLSTFEKNLYLIKEKNTATSTDLNALTVKGDIIIDSKDRTINTSGTISAKNFVLYNGTIAAQDNSVIKSQEDIILLGESYSLTDKSRLSNPSNNDYLYQAERTSASWNYDRNGDGTLDNNDLFSTTALRPDSTPLPIESDGFSGIYQGGTSSSFYVGKNWYANGLKTASSTGLTGTNQWYIDLPDLTDTQKQTGFAETYNSYVSHSTVRCYTYTGTEHYSDGSYAAMPSYDCQYENDSDGNSLNNVNYLFSDLKITKAYTVRDNVIRIFFNRPVRNSSNELSKALSRFSNSLADYAGGFYTDPDCKNPILDNTNITKDSDGNICVYLNAGDSQSWNTDATGTNAGSDSSTDRKGLHQTCIPYINVAENSSYPLTDIWGKKLSYYDDDTHRCTDVKDYTGPVLYSVRTGQELHTTYNSTTGEASQPSYDAHNFIEFRYSEKVNFGDLTVASTDISQNTFDNTDLSSKIWLPAAAATLTGNFCDTQNVRVNDSFGALTTQITESGKLTFAGLGTIESGKIYTASEGNSDKYVNALYRTDPYSIRISIAGYTEGSATDQNGNTYKKWPGYIEEALEPSGLVTLLSDTNPLVTDCATDGTSPLYNPQIKYADEVNPTVNVEYSTSNSYSDSGTYGHWDLSQPVFATIRLNADQEWQESEYFEAIGATSGSGSTLEKIEFHCFDNTPLYSSSDQAVWLSEKGWVKNEPNSTTLYDSTYTYCADITGGSRPFAVNQAERTSGGIRFSTIENISAAFKYSTNQNASTNPSTDFVSGASGLFTGAKSSLFTGSSSPSRSPTDPDGLYFGLALTDQNLPVKQSFTVTYDENKGYLTDLAGNRLRSKKIKTVDRTPPSFDIILSPVNQKEMYIVFVKRMITDSSQLSYKDSNGNQKEISETFEELAPKCFELITISSTGSASVSTDLQIDYTVPAVVKHIKSQKNESEFTIVKLTLTNNIKLEDVENLYIRLIIADGYDQYSQDPVTGTNDSQVTFVQDQLGNYMPCNEAHSLSDFAINTVNPLYAYDDSQVTSDGNSVLEGLYYEGSWAVHTWDDSFENYNTLSANRNYNIVTKVDDGSQNQDYQPQGLRLYLSSNPLNSSISSQYNSDLNENLRIWLPDLSNGIISAFSKTNNPKENYTQIDSTSLTGDNAGLYNFEISDQLSSQWESGKSISFLFGLLDSNDEIKRIYNAPYYDVTNGLYNFSQSTSIPLFCLRLKDSSDITSIDLWSFKTKSQREQRGGVSIYNNVINVTNGEKTIIKVTMPSQGNLNVMVMTLDGNVITYLNRGQADSGDHYYTWDGKNMNKQKVARGMYFIRVTGSGIDETRKVMVVK